MSTQSMPYIIRLLGSTTIRVVRISPGLWNEPVRCRLDYRELNDTSERSYEALSYVWGRDSPEFSDGIYLEGVLFQVTVNLSRALRYLRKADEDRYLWIDALVSPYSSIFAPFPSARFPTPPRLLLFSASIRGTTESGVHKLASCGQSFRMPNELLSLWATRGATKDGGPTLHSLPPLR